MLTSVCLKFSPINAWSKSTFLASLSFKKHNLIQNLPGNFITGVTVTYDAGLTWVLVALDIIFWTGYIAF